MNIITKKNAAGFAVFNTVLWGSNYVWAKLALDYVPPLLALLLCDVISLVMIGGYMLIRKSKLSFKGIKGSLWIQLFLVLANAIFLIGLDYTSSSNAAFIIQFTVVLVPLLEALLTRRLPAIVDIFVMCVAIIGLAIITLDFSSITVNPGDLLMVAASLCYAVNIVLLSRRNTAEDDSLQLVCSGFILATVICGVLILIFGPGEIPDASFFRNPIFYIAIAGDVLSYFFSMVIQIHVTKYLKSGLIAVIYCLEPVFTVIIAFLILREVMMVQTAMGSAIIIAAILISFKRDYFLSKLQKQRGNDYD